MLHLVAKNGAVNISELYCKIYDTSYFLEADEDGYILLPSDKRRTPVARLNVEGSLMSDEILMNTVETGELPELIRDGYSFDGWKGRNGNTVTEWRGTKIADKVTATWSEKTASVFGEGGIWMVLTFVFFISTVVLAIMYKRKNSEA